MVDPLVRKECFSVLGLRMVADAQQVRSAYKDLALRFHPDRPTGNAETFKKIHTAYTVLIQWFESKSGNASIIEENSFFSSSTGSFTKPVQRATRTQNTTKYSSSQPTSPSASSRPRGTTTGSFMNATASSSSNTKPPVDKNSPLYRKTLPKKASTLNAADNAQRAADAARSMAAKCQQAVIPRPREPFTIISVDRSTNIILDISAEAFRIARAPTLYHKAPIRRRQDGMKGSVIGVLPKDASMYWYKEGSNIPTPLPGRPDHYSVITRPSVSPTLRRHPAPISVPSSSAPSSRGSSLSSSSCLEGTFRSSCGEPPRVGQSGLGSRRSNLDDTLRSAASSASWSRFGDDPLASTVPCFSTNFHSTPTTPNQAASVTSFSSKYGTLSSLLTKTKSSPALNPTVEKPYSAFTASERFTAQISRCRDSQATASSSIASKTRSARQTVVMDPPAPPPLLANPNVRFYRPQSANTGAAAGTTCSSSRAQSISSMEEEYNNYHDSPQPIVGEEPRKNLFVDPFLEQVVAQHVVGEPTGSPSGVTFSEVESLDSTLRSKSSPESNAHPAAVVEGEVTTPIPSSAYFDVEGVKSQHLIPEFGEQVEEKDDEDEENEDFGLERLFSSYSEGNEVEQKETQSRAEILLRYNAFIYEVVHRHKKDQQKIRQSAILGRS